LSEAIFCRAAWGKVGRRGRVERLTQAVHGLGVGGNALAGKIGLGGADREQRRDPPDRGVITTGDTIRKVGGWRRKRRTEGGIKW